MRYCCIEKKGEDKTESHLLPAQMTFWTGTKEKHQRPCSTIFFFSMFNFCKEQQGVRLKQPEVS